MVEMLNEELCSQGWVQLIKSYTHYANRAGATSETLIDHVWTNAPAKIGRSGQVDLAASDHHMVWVERLTRKLAERVKKTEKRSFKNFKLESLHQLCREEKWHFQGTGPRTEEMLDRRVQQLEDKIINVLEKVAPMVVKKTKYKGRPRWLTPRLLERMKERENSRKKAIRSKTMVDEMEARRMRNEVSKEVKGAEKDYMRQKLWNLSNNSPDS